MYPPVLVVNVSEYDILVYGPQGCYSNPGCWTPDCLQTPAIWLMT